MKSAQTELLIGFRNLKEFKRTAETVLGVEIPKSTFYYRSAQLGLKRNADGAYDEKDFKLYLQLHEWLSTGMPNRITNFHPTSL